MTDLKAELLKSEAPIGAPFGSLQTGADGGLPKVNDVSKTLLKQIEYYFSNNNLWRDQFLLTEIAKDPEGWVPINLVAEFSRIKALSSDLLQICSALRQSKKLELSRDLFKVRRIHVVPPYNPKKDAKRTIYVDKLPPGSTLKSVRKLFSKFGRVTYVTKVDPLGQGITPNFDVRDAPPQEVSNTAEITTALVEFAKKEAAKKAITMIQAHNIKRGIIFPATPTYGSSQTTSYVSPSGGPSAPSPSLQPVVAMTNEPPFEIKALDFKLKKTDSPSTGSPTSPPTGNGGFGIIGSGMNKPPITTSTTASLITVTPATILSTASTILNSPPSGEIKSSSLLKESQSAPSSVSSSPAGSPPSSQPSSTLVSPSTGSSPPRSTLSPHASPFVPSSPSIASTTSPAITPTSFKPHGELYTPGNGTPQSSPGTSPSGSPTSTPSGTPAGSLHSSSPPSPPGSNNSPPKEIDINLYTGFHILTKMSYLKKLSQLHPHPSDVTSLSSETKKTLASGGKQSPFRFLGAKPSPRSPFSQIWPPVDGDSSQNRSKGHNRSHSNPSNYSTYPPQGLPISSPPSYGKTTGRSTPDRSDRSDRGMGGRATPDRNHNGRATPDRSSGGRATPDRSSGGRATPDRSSGGRATPDRSSGGRATPDRSNNRARTPDRSGRSGTPDQQHRQGGQSTPPSQSRAFLIPRPSSGTGHRSGEGGSRDRSNSGSTFTSPRAMPPRSGTPGGTRTTPGGTPGQSPARDNHDNHDNRGRAGSVDQGSKEYYERKYAEEKIRNDQLQKKLQKLLSGGSPSDVSPVADRSGGGSPRGSPKASPSKGRRRAKSSDIGGDKSERGYIPPVEEQSSRPKLKLLSSRLSSSGQSIAQRFAQGPDETGGFLGGRGAGRGRGSPASTAVSS